MHGGKCAGTVHIIIIIIVKVSYRVFYVKLFCRLGSPRPASFLTTVGLIKSLWWMRRLKA